MVWDDLIMRDEIADLIGAAVQNLGYPVGMGIPPHPETMKRLADEILKMLKE